MGVNLNVYGIFGIKIDDRDFYDKINYIWDLDDGHSEDDELTEEVINAKELIKHCEIIQDGYCGEYTIIGTKIYGSGDFRYGWDEPEKNTPYTIQQLLEIEIKQKELLKKCGIEISEPFTFFGIKHYS